MKNKGSQVVVFDPAAALFCPLFHTTGDRVLVVFALRWPSIGPVEGLQHVFLLDKSIVEPVLHALVACGDLQK